ncbi:MAG: four helix bundle protein [Minisyncoccia bacterium]|jgi:hypothetical protein
MKTNVPVVVRLIEVYKVWHEFMPNMAKTSRFTLGQKIDDLFIETTELIFLASHLTKEQKVPYLQKASAKLDLLKLFIQISWEIKAIDNGKFITLSEPLEEVGKMLGGWLRQTMSRSEPAGHRQ